MNRIKRIKILLLAIITSLSILFIPIERWNPNENFDFVTTKKTVEIKIYTQSQCKLTTEIVIEEIKSDYDYAINEMNTRMNSICDITDKKEWFKSYKSVIDEYRGFIDPPETIYDCFMEDELDILFRVVQAEVGDEYSFEQKVNVATVIFNRLNHERFLNNLSEILTPDQFSPIASGRCENIEVSELTILACEYAFQIGGDIAEECLFFDSNGRLKYEYVDNDGAHNFYKLSGTEK